MRSGLFYSCRLIRQERVGLSVVASPLCSVLSSVAFAVNLQDFGKETGCDKRPVYPHLRELQRYKVLIIMTIN